MLKLRPEDPIMPWEKNFNIDDALEKAMGIFWSRGYEATSMQDLVHGMGLNRGSIYDTFESKRALFIAALKRYDRKCRHAWLCDLENTHPPRKAIRRLFDEWLEVISHDSSRRGCFLTNTALEVAAHDDEIGAIVAASQKETEKFFYRVIKAGQKTGEIAPDLHAKDISRALLAALIGLLVLARSRPERALMRSIADGAMAQLR